METNKVNLMEDYGLTCGRVIAADGNADNVPDPIEYLNEFMEAAWQPSREDCAEFLSNFYDMERICQWVNSVAWDQDDVDIETQEMRDLTLDMLGNVVYEYLGCTDVNIVEPVWDALNTRIRSEAIENIGDFVVQFVEAIKDVKAQG